MKHMYGCKKKKRSVVIQTGAPINGRSAAIGPARLLTAVVSWLLLPPGHGADKQQHKSRQR